jgi:hypothetical protein
VQLLPEVNDPVVLVDESQREYRSRAEDVRVGLVVVARPLDLRVDDPLGPGREVNVVWTDDDGVSTVLPTRILAAHAEGTLDLWSLAVTGPAVRQQRRQFVRSPAMGPVVLSVGDDEEADPVHGTLLDVSEAALRCLVEVGAADALLTSGDQVVAQFRYGNGDFAVPGRVEFLRASAHPSEVEQVVVVFDEPVTDGDDIRREIFAQEARALRARGQER